MIELNLRPDGDWASLSRPDDVSPRVAVDDVHGGDSQEIPYIFRKQRELVVLLSYGSIINLYSVRTDYRQTTEVSYKQHSILF